MLKARLSIFVIVALSFCGCMRKEVTSGLNEQDAQEIIVVLKAKGLEADAVRSAGDRNAAPTWTVEVRGGAQNAVLAWRIMEENGLPRQKVKGLDEVYSSVGMIPTASEEKARLLMALSGELTRTLKSVEGVVDARVQIVLPDNSLLLDKSQWNSPTGSVLIKYRAKQPLTKDEVKKEDPKPLTEDEVKKLVARGVEGLQPENVAVVFKQTEPVNQPAKDVSWYLADSQIVVAALSLMSLAALGSLVLAFRGWRHRAKIQELQLQIKELTRVPQVKA